MLVNMECLNSKNTTMDCGTNAFVYDREHSLILQTFDTPKTPISCMEEKHTCQLFFTPQVTKRTETKEALPQKTNKNTEDNICHGFLINFSLMAMMQQIVPTSLQHKHPCLSFLIYYKIQRAKKRYQNYQQHSNLI